MRILIIDDDEKILDSLSSKLQQAGYTVDTLTDGRNGSYVARTNKYDLIIIDLLLKGKDGTSVCKEIREASNHTPIIFLTVENSINKKVEVFDLGADDYLTKPFSFSELLARIKVLVRRPAKIAENTCVIDDLCIDMNKQEVRRHGDRVYLTRKEYSLLECMARKPGVVVSRGEILEDAWGYDTNPFSNTIEAHIRNIRKKIGETKNSKYIQTVPGRGYKLDRNR